MSGFPTVSGSEPLIENRVRFFGRPGLKSSCSGVEDMRSFGSHILIAAALAVASPVFAKDTVMIELRSGDGGRSVGIISASEEVEASGPAAITVGDDGTIYILDQNNGRVLAVDAERSQADPEILPLPENSIGARNNFQRFASMWSGLKIGCLIPYAAQT
ncbi:hypothetical protein JOH51_005834 [Rhizobium leguminosarum]|nr:hypothetical protein [Rhizobium leguminosarum]